MTLVERQALSRGKQAMAISASKEDSEVNEDIVGLIQHRRVPVAGFGGWEKSLIRASRRLHILPTGETVDLGRVGDVASVNAKPIRALQGQAIVPVLAALGIGVDALTYNINADLVAGGGRRPGGEPRHLPHGRSGDRGP